MKLSRSIGLTVALAVYVLVCAASVASLLPRTRGQYIYPLDDTYISMAMAKNLVQHGAMGLTRDGFSASSSCPLWILLIGAAYGLTGVTWWAPLALGLLAGMGALIAAYQLIAAHTERQLVIGGVLIAICFLTPLPALSLSGMEHSLHIALVLGFVFTACRYLQKDSHFAARDLYFMALLMSAMVLVRFESLFLAGIFCGLAMLRRKPLAGAVVMASAVIPVFLFGLYSVSQGWNWLPNSVLLKGSMPQFSSVTDILMALGFRSLIMLVLTPHLGAIAGVLAISWIVRKRRAGPGAGFWEPAQLMVTMAVLGILAHLQFASVGWFFRYEAYLVALGIASLACNVLDLSRGGWRLPRMAMALVALVAVLAATPAVLRGVAAISGFRTAAYNVFEQQYQMAGFLNRYYNGASIAANDVGAINFVNDLHCLDLVGLCDREVFRLRRGRQYDTNAVESLATRAHVRIAIIYKTWFDGKNGPAIPPEWKLVGEWRVTDNGFLGGDTVGFYATGPQEVEYLAHSLESFSPQLPDTVVHNMLPVVASGGSLRR